MPLNNEATTLNDSSSIPEDFISVVCHYDSYTVITRTGELSQIIQVQGYKTAFNQPTNERLRDLVRQALVEAITNDDILVQLHVVRDFADITSNGNNFTNQKASNIDNAWNKFNSWHHRLDNKLYIVITHRGLRNYVGLNNFVRQLIPWSLKNKALSNLEQYVQELNEVTNHIKIKLKDFKSHALTIKYSKDKSQYISEPLSFIYYLLHFIHVDIPVESVNFATQATTAGLTKEFFNSKYLEHSNINGTDASAQTGKYAAIFSLKTSYNISIQAAERILQANYKFIISETIMFAEIDMVNTTWLQHKKLYDASKFPDMAAISGLNDLLAHKNNKITDFCKNQITIAIIADNNRDLQSYTLNFGSIIAEIGISFIRDDILMSGLFYAMVPGNNRYLSRLFDNNIERIAPFCNTTLRGVGKKTHSNWGPPMMLISELTTGISYHFHLYNDKDNPEHCLIIKSSRSHHHSNNKEENVLRFMLAQSMRFNPAIVNIDLEGIHQDFTTKMEGYTIDIGRDDEVSMKIGLNLFDVCLKHDASMDLLLEIIRIYINKGEFISSELSSLIKDTVKSSSSMDDEQNTTNGGGKYSYAKIAKSFAALAAENNAHTCIVNFANFLNNPPIHNVFSYNKLDSLSHAQRRKIMLHLNLKILHGHSPEAAELLVLLLLTQLPELLNNTPTIIALSNADFIFKSPQLAEIFMNGLNKLLIQNCVLIMSIANMNQIASLPSADAFFALYANKFFMTDRKMTRSYKNVLGLEESEIYKIRSFDRNEGNFLLKRRDCTFLSNINLSFMNEVY